MIGYGVQPVTFEDECEKLLASLTDAELRAGALSGHECEHLDPYK